MRAASARPFQTKGEALEFQCSAAIGIGFSQLDQAGRRFLIAGRANAQPKNPSIWPAIASQPTLQDARRTK